MTFGIVSEGPTDQIVLRHILAAYLSDPDIDIRPVQPNADSTDEEERLGGWTRMLKYCESEDMLPTLEENNFVILQIDTDICEDLGVSKRYGGEDVSDENIIEGVKQVIINRIGQELFNIFSEKLIFAISHGSIECWLLGIYYSNNDRFKTDNCCSKLNQRLSRVEGFTIDCDEKKPKFYYKVCRQIKKKDFVLNLSKCNGSLKLFVDQLERIEHE